MKYSLPVLFLFTALMGVSLAQTNEKSSWDNYEPRTLQSIVDAHKDSVADLDKSPSNPKKMVISGDSFPSKVCLIYLGKSRPIVGERKELLRAWKKAFRPSEPGDLAEVFPTEVLFREGDREFWVAVQKPLLDPLPKEVKRDSKMNAYVIWMGAIRAGDHWEWLFAMNEFDKPTSTKAP